MASPFRTFARNLSPFSIEQQLLRRIGQHQHGWTVVNLATRQRMSSAVSWRPRRIEASTAGRFKARLPDMAAFQANIRSSILNQTSRRKISQTARKQSTGSSQQAQAQEPTSMSARLKKLTREYGWTAVGVYFALSVLDFPFCFLLVRYLGTERIAEAEHWVTSKVKVIIPESVVQWWHDYRKALKTARKETIGDGKVAEGVDMVGWGVEQAQERNKSEASLATQLALAYAIHKSFIFIRIPLTAAILPKVVKVLRSWGWRIGRKAV